MATSHTVKQGEHISRIARLYGFRDYRTIWNHSANAELKKKRIDPHVLLPGDVLQIPDKQLKSESRAVDAQHRFQVVTRSLKLRVSIRDLDNVPVPGAACELVIEGNTYQLTTNAEGIVEHNVIPTDENGRLRVPALDIDVPLKIGHLDPPDEDTGWHARLANLGYSDDALTEISPAELQSDVEEFQCDFGLKVTGVLDEPTKAKLKQIHGV